MEELHPVVELARGIKPVCKIAVALGSMKKLLLMRVRPGVVNGQSGNFLELNVPPPIGQTSLKSAMFV
jgi:hypothetical protein